MRWYTPRKANILLALGTVLVCLFLLEVGARVLAHLENQNLLDVALDQGVEIPLDGPVELGHIIRRSANRRIVYELKSNLSVFFEGALLTTDSRGFRSLEPGPSSPERSGDVVGIGDSFMFGFGVEADQTYLAVLEDMLAARKPENAYRIVNTAVPGYNTVMEVETLKEKALDLDPSVVIIEFVENDLSLPNFVRADKPVLTLRRSLFADWVRHRLGHFRKKSLWRRLQIAGLQGIPQGGPDGEGNTTDPSLVPEKYRDLVGWEAYSRAMTELRDLGDRHGFRIVSIFLAPGESPLKTRALDLSRQLGFDVLDIGLVFQAHVEANAYQDYARSPLARSPTDGHPSALGHRIAGETLLDFFVEREILPVPGPER